jgi:hypothetical protein
VQAVAKKLPVSAVFLAMLAAVIGGVIGALAGGLIGSLLASATHIPAREGESGYFIIFIALIAIVIATPAAVLLTLYWRGIRRLWLLIGSIVTFAGIFVLATAGFGIWYTAQPHILNANGPTPRLEFEVKPPDGVSVQTLVDVQAELDTDRKVMPADWKGGSDNRDRGVRGGAVDLYFRTSQRLFVLKFPGHEDRIFRLKFPANPMKARYRDWSDWQNPEFVAKPDTQPTRYSGTADYQIRYRVDY